MDPAKINYFAVGLAALSSFLVGGAWYSPVLFAKPWMKHAGLTDEDLKNGSPLKIFGGSFVLALLMSFNLAAFIGPDATLGFGLFAGFAAGFGWAAASTGITYLFERRPLQLWLINGGYQIVSLSLMGAILGAL